MLDAILVPFLSLLSCSGPHFKQEGVRAGERLHGTEALKKPASRQTSLDLRRLPVITSGLAMLVPIKAVQV